MFLPVEPSFSVELAPLPTIKCLPGYAGYSLVDERIQIVDIASIYKEIHLLQL